MTYTLAETCDPQEHIYTKYYESKYNVSLGYLSMLFMLNLFQYFMYTLYFYRYTDLANQVTDLLQNIKAKYNIFEDEDIRRLDINNLQKSLDKDIGVYEDNWCLTNEHIANS